MPSCYISAYSKHLPTNTPAQIVASAALSKQIEEHLTAAGIVHDKGKCIDAEMMRHHVHLDSSPQWNINHHLHQIDMRASPEEVEPVIDRLLAGIRLKGPVSVMHLTVDGVLSEVTWTIEMREDLPQFSVN